jgi:cell division protein FtsI/penicillin-binding protein 2
MILTNRDNAGMMITEEIPQKANRVLNLILAGLILILFRAWHLAIVEHEARVEEARKPQNRTILEPAKRGTIRDRFNVPLAINKVQYNAAVLYAPIRAIPTVIWKMDADGNKIKVYKRKEHIKGLSKAIAKELKLDEQRIEDLLYAKASLYNQTPFVLKEDISEEQYYRLKMLERQWQGLHMQKVPKRFYPQGRLAADILGYMGAINREEYETIFHKIEELKEFLALQELGEDPPYPQGFTEASQVLKRLKELEERAYTINDAVGKAGIEGRFEEQLRGFHGKRSYASDARGNFLRELARSKEPYSGQRILLTLSAELQQYAEQLLAESESLRKARISGMSLAKQDLINLSEPWIKGGAIVAMDPNNGELLALASYPRIDSNDFILGNRANIVRWYESEAYLADIWDQKRPIEREVFAKKRYREEEMRLTWTNYLKFILPERNAFGETHEVYTALSRIENLTNAILLPRTIDKLLILSGNNDLMALLNLLYPKAEVTGDVIEAMRCNLEQHEKYVSEARQRIDPFLSELSVEEQVLVIDLCQLAVAEDRFDETLLEEVGSQTLEKYREVCGAFVKVNEAMRQMAKALYHEIDFVDWRAREGKEYLKKKRLEEKAAHRYARPYIDYLDKREAESFEEFWKERRWDLAKAFLLGEGTKNCPYEEVFLGWHQELKQGAHAAVEWRESYNTLLSALPQKEAIPYLKTLRSFKDLTRPLLGKIAALRKLEPIEKDLAAAFYPRYGFGYGRSYAYRQAAHQGSIFKLVTAYQALIERYQDLAVNQEKITVESLNPLEIIDIYKHRGRHKIVGYHLDGKPIYQLYKGGRIPKSALRDIGHVDMLGAIEYSSNPYFAILAGDVIKDPENLAKAAREFSFGEKTGVDLPSEIKGGLPKDLKENKHGLYSFAIGHHTLVSTPLQTAVLLSALANGGKVLKPKIIRMTVESGGYLVKRVPTEVKRELFLPQIVRQILLEGMQRVINRTQSGAVSSLMHIYREQPHFVRDFADLKGQLVGKSSTSESVERVNLDPKLGLHKFNHIWFGGIAFEVEQEGEKATLTAKDRFGHPELVVIVYLRYGEWGKDTAPIAAQMVKKWREIKAKYPST